MEMFTVGAAIRFAVKLETTAASAYTQAVEQTSAVALKNLFEKMAAANAKRIRTLNRLYEDNVYSDMDTGVLAPIASLHGRDYTPPEPVDSVSPVEDGLQREKIGEKFYTDLAQRLDSGPRTLVRGFAKLAAENRKRAERLASSMQA